MELLCGTLQSPLHLEPGTVFGGDFKVVSPLERGGMGAVYVVEQLSTHKRRALKLMLAARAADPALRKRFEQEARVGAMIPSEHVVDVIAAGVDAQTQIPWLAMELLEGEDLATFVARRGAATPAEVYDVFAQLCHALAAAHAIPVVHRDLKPGNIFLARPRLAEARFVVKVLDFGIAKIVGDTPSTTAAVGTPLWMAPEQTKARATVDPAADVWALGLIAFQLLTGRLYWESANDPEAQAMTVMREVLFDPIVPASDRAKALGVGEHIPPGFDAWFAKCVVREVDQRLPSAKEAWAALAEVLAPGRLARSGSIPDVASANLVSGPRASGPRTGGVVVGPGRTPHPDALASTMLSTPAPVQSPPPTPPPAIGTTLGTSELASRPEAARSRALPRAIIGACVLAALVAIVLVAMRYGGSPTSTSAASSAASNANASAVGSAPSVATTAPSSSAASSVTTAAASALPSAAPSSSSSAGAGALHASPRVPSPRGSGGPAPITTGAAPNPTPPAPPKSTSTGSTPYLL